MCTILYFTIVYTLYSTPLCSTLLYYTTLYSTRLSSTLLYYTLLCSTLLYSTLFHYTILYIFSTRLCYTILCYAVSALLCSALLDSTLLLLLLLLVLLGTTPAAVVHYCDAPPSVNQKRKTRFGGGFFIGRLALL